MNRHDLLNPTKKKKRPGRLTKEQRGSNNIRRRNSPNANLRKHSILSMPHSVLASSRDGGLFAITNGPQIALISRSENASLVALEPRLSSVVDVGARKPNEQIPQPCTRVLLFSDDSKYLVSVGDDKVLAVHETQSGKCVASRVFDKKLSAACLICDHVLVGDKFGNVFQAEMPNLGGVCEVMGHVGTITSLAASASGSYVISADRDEKIRVSRWPDVYVIQSWCFAHTKSPIKAIGVLARDGKEMVLSSGLDGKLCLFDCVSGALLDTVVPADGRALMNCAFCECLGVVAVSSNDIGINAGDSKIMFYSVGKSLVELGQVSLPDVASAILFDLTTFRALLPGCHMVSFDVSLGEDGSFEAKLISNDGSGDPVAKMVSIVMTEIVGENPKSTAELLLDELRRFSAPERPSKSHRKQNQQDVHDGEGN